MFHFEHSVWCLNIVWCDFHSASKFNTHLHIIWKINYFHCVLVLKKRSEIQVCEKKQDSEIIILLQKFRESALHFIH